VIWQPYWVNEGEGEKPVHTKIELRLRGFLRWRCPGPTFLFEEGAKSVKAPRTVYILAQGTLSQKYTLVGEKEDQQQGRERDKTSSCFLLRDKC